MTIPSLNLVSISFPVPKKSPSKKFLSHMKIFVINFLFYPRFSTLLLTRRSFPPKRHNTRSSVWMFGGFSLFSTSTAQALVAVRGPAVTYGLLKFTPLIESHAHSLDISGFTIRRGSEKFTLQDIPVSQILRSEEHTSELQSLMRISYA